MRADEHDTLFHFRDARGKDESAACRLLPKYAKCYEISEALFGKKYAICDFNVPCGKIADLIDRPTCLDLVEHKQDPFIPGKRMVDGYFHCSDCGWDGQIWEHIGFGDMLAYEAVHCPKCGAIIERRA